MSRKPLPIGEDRFAVCPDINIDCGTEKIQEKYGHLLQKNSTRETEFSNF